MRWAQAIRLIKVLFDAARFRPRRHSKNSQPVLRYAGSSTIAHFIRDARMAYTESRFLLSTECESSGGEVAILGRKVDLAGVARRPLSEGLASGLAFTAIGYDSISVVVNLKNSADSFTRADLQAIFTGAITNWERLSGPSVPVRRFIPLRESATHEIFRGFMLGDDSYVGCEVVPVPEILTKVSECEGGIGFVSSSFLYRCERVRVCAIQGQLPDPGAPGYELRRPLYLLWRPGEARVEHFVSWATSPAAHTVLLRRFAPWR